MDFQKVICKEIFDLYQLKISRYQVTSDYVKKGFID
jgi:hypothetical protein